MADIFESSVRSGGDLAGVFEGDEETSYFYLYKTADSTTRKVVDAIHISTGARNYEASDIAILWDEDERKVGLQIHGELWAVFDCESGKKFGGDFSSAARSNVPLEVKRRFGTY